MGLSGVRALILLIAIGALNAAFEVPGNKARFAKGHSSSSNNVDSKTDSETAEIMEETDAQPIGRQRRSEVADSGNSFYEKLNEIRTPSHGNARVKRAYKRSCEPWPQGKIPLVFELGYSQQTRQQVNYAAQIIKDYTTITFIDETDNYNTSDPNYFVNRGYQSNAYLYMRAGSGCGSSYLGHPNDPDYYKVEVYPCSYLTTNVHELLHTSCLSHTPRSNSSDIFLQVFTYNAIQDYVSSQFAQNSDTYDEILDPKTTLLYSPYTFSRNGDLVMNLIVPWYNDMAYDSSELPAYKEIIDNNNVTAKYCNNSSVDCFPGYLGIVKGACRCICPWELDYNANCKSLINGADYSLTWPGPMGLYGSGPGFVCPDGFQSTGWIQFCPTTYAYDYSPYPFPKSGSTKVWFPICTYTGPTTSQRFSDGGKYCYIKAVGVSCPYPFLQYSFTMKSSCTILYNGTLGDININGNDMTTNYCCKNLESNTLVSALPNSKCFSLPPVSNGVCPTIKGMNSIYYGQYLYPTAAPSGSGSITPSIDLWDDLPYEVDFYLCTFCPPTMGCNRDIYLNATTKTVTITTQNNTSARPANRRCIYRIQGPPGSILVITFNTYSLHTSDQVLYKIMQPLNDPLRMDNKNPKTQLVSETNYTVIDYWAGFQSSSTTGLNFTAQLILSTDSCYDTSNYGAFYAGNKAVSETNEDCLPWKDMGDCDFKRDDSIATLLDTSNVNSCRNPGGRPLRPFCFVYKNGTNCMRRFCDVCNYKAQVDSVPTATCQSYIASDPNFCTTAIQRVSCLKSCNIAQPSATRDCPSGCTTYHARCVCLNQTKVAYSAARTNCLSLTPKETLLRITSLEDQSFFRQLSKLAGGSILTPYIAVYQETSTAGRWFAVSNASKNYYACQTSRLPSCGQPTIPSDGVLVGTALPNYYTGDRIQVQCKNQLGDYSTLMCTQLGWSSLTSACSGTITNDRVTTCQTTLRNYPFFCSDSKSASIGNLYCYRSCGGTTDTANCSAPTSNSYNRISPSASIRPGSVMTFNCTAGYLYVSGDLNRACGVNGTLLGTEPVCQTNPAYVDVALWLVRPSDNTLKPQTIVAIDFDGYRIPIPGRVTTWYSYCKNSGPVFFLLYRKSGTNFNQLGYFQTTCVAGARWSYKVPTNQQITVQANDLVGVYTNTSSILYTEYNDGDLDSFNMSRSATISGVGNLATTTSLPIYTFTVPSVACRVES